MGSHMRCEIAGLRKTLIAYTALKWFFTSVGSNVNIERAGPFKGFVAVITMEWTFTCMATHMVT